MALQPNLLSFLVNKNGIRKWLQIETMSKNHGKIYDYFAKNGVA